MRRMYVDFTEMFTVKIYLSYDWKRQAPAPKDVLCKSANEWITTKKKKCRQQKEKMGLQNEWNTFSNNGWKIAETYCSFLKFTWMPKNEARIEAKPTTWAQTSIANEANAKLAQRAKWITKWKQSHSNASMLLRFKHMEHEIVLVQSLLHERKEWVVNYSSWSESGWISSECVVCSQKTLAHRKLVDQRKTAINENGKASDDVAFDGTHWENNEPKPDVYFDKRCQNFIKLNQMNIYLLADCLDVC